MALKLLNKIKSIDVLSPSVKDMLEKSIDKDKIAAKLKDLEADGIEIAEKLAVETQDLQNKVTEFITHKAVDLKQWYSDNQIQDKLEKVAKKVGATVIYPVLLLYNLLNSPNVIVHDKMLIIAPLAYFIMPADLIPDVILGAGYVDDGVAIMTALKTFGSSITPEITDQTRKMCKKLIGEVDENVINQVMEKIKQNTEE